MMKINKNYKIFNKDCRQLSKYIDEGSIDFIVFSPPYWNLRDYGYLEQIGHKQPYEEYLQNMKKVFSECFKVLKEGRFMAINIGTVVSNEGMKFIAGDFVKECIEVGFNFRKDVIWHKPRGTTKWQRGATQFTQNPYPLRFNTNINHEYILIFQKGDLQEIDFSDKKKFNKSFLRDVAYSVWDIIPVNSPKMDEKHVAPFPEELPKKLIHLFSFKGDTVLDPFAGCGTTNKVAYTLGRKTIAVELSKDYCKLIEDKINETQFDSDNNGIYDTSDECLLKLEQQKLKSSRDTYLKQKKKYEKLLKEIGDTRGLKKFMG